MKNKLQWFLSNWVTTIVVIFYLTLVVLLLLAELGVTSLEWIRATDQVLLLLALFFLPFLVLVSPQLIRSVTVKASGQEVHLELGELRHDVALQFDRVERNFSAQVSTAEQALWPLLAGPDVRAHQRLAAKQLIIGSKLDASQVFFAYFLAEWIHYHLPDVTCEPRVPNGGSLKNFADVRFGYIDLYIDFTGTCAQFFSIDHKGKSREQIIAELNRFGDVLGLRWLEPLGATENYCIVIRQEVAEKYRIRTLQDLAIFSNELVFVADPEFLNRRDCYLGLAKAYGLQFKRTETCQITERYAMVAANEADVFVGYETDPELRASDLIVLEDKEEFFPSYDDLPLVRTAALEAIDGLEAVLCQLRDIMTTDDLVEQVFKVRNLAGGGITGRDIAHNFLLQCLARRQPHHER
jgi:osmoprotectant transport system permease protein